MMINVVDRGQHGMSLVEILVAMFILAVAALGTAPMFVLSIDANTIGDDYSPASSLASNVLEKLEAEGVANNLPILTEEENVLGRFARTTTILGHEDDSTIPQSLARVEVMLSWTDKDGYLRTTSTRSLVEIIE